MSYDLFLHHSFSVQFCSQISPCYAFEPLSEAHNTINIHASNVDTWHTHERWMTWKSRLVIAGLRDKRNYPTGCGIKTKHVIPWDTRDKFIPLRPYTQPHSLWNNASHDRLPTVLCGSSVCRCRPTTWRLRWCEIAILWAFNNSSGYASICPISSPLLPTWVASAVISSIFSR